MVVVVSIRWMPNTCVQGFIFRCNGVNTGVRREDNDSIYCNATVFEMSPMASLDGDIEMEYEV